MKKTFFFFLFAAIRCLRLYGVKIKSMHLFIFFKKQTNIRSHETVIVKKREIVYNKALRETVFWNLHYIIYLLYVLRSQNQSIDMMN